MTFQIIQGFPGGSDCKESAAMQEIWVRPLGREDPLQYSCLENPMDRGAWRAKVHEFAESDTADNIKSMLFITARLQLTPIAPFTSSRIHFWVPYWKKKSSYIISVANFNFNSMITSLKLTFKKILITSSLIQLFQSHSYFKTHSCGHIFQSQSLHPKNNLSLYWEGQVQTSF